MAISRKRGPSYPVISFPEAVGFIDKIYHQAGIHPADNEVFAQILGYKGLSGRSRRVIAALSAFALLEGRGDSLRVSEIGQTLCIEPHDSATYQEALADAVRSPPIYGEVLSRYPDKLPGEPVLNAFLQRRGFSPEVAKQLCADIEESFEFAGLYADGAESIKKPQSEEVADSSHVPEQQVPPADMSDSRSGARRTLFSYNFEPSGSVEVILTGDIEPKKAISMLEKLIDIKKGELDMPNE